MPACLLLAVALVVPHPPPHGGRLAGETSPYLLRHARDPIAWHSWGPAAFAVAERERKLVFLSVGYSACHWCHVMARETFADPAVVRTLNTHFVCVKVDREERPDIDDVYQAAMRASGRTGGWPLTIILTADGKPVQGGSYYPPDDKKVPGGTLTGLKTVLKGVLHSWATDRGGVEATAAANAAATTALLDAADRLVAPARLDREAVTAAARAFDLDPVHGGVGDKSRDFRHAKFPRAAALGFLLHHGRRDEVMFTLRKIAAGGLYDHLGGGFHRYCTDRAWAVPHFEKMLPDTAQLVELYADAHRLAADPLYARVVAESLAFVRREMTAPDGGFYSSLDADSGGVEGGYYLWTADEIDAALGADADFFKGVYTSGKPPFVLRLPHPPPDGGRLAAIRAKLLARREGRERPFRDTTILAGWNGMMIAAFARAGEVFGEPAHIRTAATAADFVLTHMRGPDGRLRHARGGRGAAFLADHADLLHGLLALHDATGDARWLAAARTTAADITKWHADGRGGFSATARDHEKLFARARDADGTAAAARGFLRLWRKTGDPAYRDAAAAAVKASAGMLKATPGAVPGLARCLAELLDAGWVDRPAAAAVAGQPRESADVVSATVKADGARLTITLTIAAPWHVYANPPGSPDLAASATAVEVLVGGKPVEAAVEYPKGEATTDAGGTYRVYRGAVTIAVTPPRAGPVEVRVRVSACKDGTCLLPSVIPLK